MRLLVAGLFALLATGYAQTPAADAVVEGAVIDSLSRRGVPGARVSLHCMYLAERADCIAPVDTVTAEDGSFRFAELPAGAYLLLPFVKGYLMPKIVPEARVAASQQLRGVIVQVDPEVILSGSVINSGDEPVSGAEVTALMHEREQGRVRLVAWGKASTDARGRWQIDDLRAGRYIVRVRKGRDWAYYPGGASVQLAAALDTDPGQRREGLNIKLAALTGYRVAGRVESAEESVRTGAARASLVPGNPGDAEDLGRSAKVSADGTFVFDSVIPGMYTLDVAHTRWVKEVGRTRLLARAAVPVPAKDVADLVVAAPPPCSLAGRVRVEEGEPLKSGRVELLPVGYSGSVSAADISADGSFTIEGCEPVEYRLALAAEGSYIASVTCNRQDAMRGPIDLRAGGSNELAIAVRTDGAALAGSVKGEKKGAAVLVPAEYVPGSPAGPIATEFADGSFVFRDLRPGSYHVLALPQVPRWLLASPEFVQEVRARGERIELDANARARLSVPQLDADGYADLLRVMGER